MAQRDLPVQLYPGYRPGVEECWMEMDGGRMRYLRTESNAPSLADAGNGEPGSSFPTNSFSSDSFPTNSSISPEKTPLILLHGLLGYSFSWRHAMPSLAPYTTVYALDMMGAGFSDRVSGLDHSMRGTARRVLQFAERLGITSFDLLGTSHGGAVAMMAAAECLQPQSRMQVRQLILVAPVNPYSAHGRRLAPFVGSPLGTMLFRHTVAHVRPVFAYAHARMYGDRSRILPGTLEGYLAPLAKPRLFEHALSIVRTWTEDLRELEATLPKLASVPTLFMWGSKDTAVFPSSAEPLAKFFPHSNLIIFPGVGHLPYEETPQEFNAALIDFLTDNNFPACNSRMNRDSVLNCD
jgi:pimeloyl-ACP methyl ester carboxylesterase